MGPSSIQRWLAYSERRRLLDADLEVAGLDSPGLVLEVGSGHRPRRGRYQAPVEKATAWIYLDLSADRSADIVADVEHLPLKDGTFDTVICLEVLEYITHPKQALCEMGRVLRPGGMLVLSAPFMHRADTEHDYWRFSEHALRHLMAETGFEVRQLRAQGAALAVAVNILKYSIAAVPSRLWRSSLAFLAYLPLAALLKLDGWSCRRLSVLGTFSTGYLVVACSSRQ